jgi:hypothetical protein
MQKTFAKHSSGKVLLVLTLLGFVAVLGSNTQAQSSPGDSPDPILGTWRFTVAGSGPNFTAYETYALGGALSAIDNQAPSSQETVAIGTWRKVGPHKYYEEQWQFLYNPDGSFYGTWVGQIEDDMDDTGTRMLPPSPYTYEIIDGNGNVVGTGSGTSWGYKLAKPKGPER